MIYHSYSASTVEEITSASMGGYLQKIPPSMTDTRTGDDNVGADICVLLVPAGVEYLHASVTSKLHQEVDIRLSHTNLTAQVQDAKINITKPVMNV